MIAPWRSSRQKGIFLLCVAKRVFSFFGFLRRGVRKVLAFGRVLCARHQDPAFLVNRASVGLAVGQVVGGRFAHRFVGFLAVFAAFLKSASVGAALEPTLFIFSPEPALIRACLARMFA
jgi:hypothetical protein